MSHHHHHHDHDTESPLSFEEKLAKLFEHWIRHNDDHVLNYKNWAERAKENNMQDVGNLLEEIAEMTQTVSRKIEAAAKRL